jgi:uncharacterized protein (TIGR00369 family)
MTEPAIPDAFTAVLAGLPEQRPSPGAGSFYGRCFGCGPEHPNGLHIRCFQTDEGVLSPIVVPREYEGPPGVAHGGIVAAYLDEVLAGAALRATGRVCVTGELTVRYVRPVPAATPILGRARLLEDHGRYLDVEGQLETVEGGRVLATGRGRFFPVDGSSA